MSIFSYSKAWALIFKKKNKKKLSRAPKYSLKFEKRVKIIAKFSTTLIGRNPVSKKRNEVCSIFYATRMRASSFASFGSEIRFKSDSKTVVFVHSRYLAIICFRCFSLLGFVNNPGPQKHLNLTKYLFQSILL